MKFEYKDYLPANARVIVDYNSEQKVGFSYPIEWTYWKAVWKRGFITVMEFWLSLNVFWSRYIAIFFLLAMIIGLIYISFYPVSIPIVYPYIDLNFTYLVLPIIIILFYSAGIPALVTLFLSLDKERLSKWIPLFGYWAFVLSGSCKEKDFTVDDVTDNKCIIPLFSNVFLDYKCYGDFNKFLQKVEILEIPFSFRERRFFLPFLSKKEKNDFHFRAVFYFSSKPEVGRMEVKFI